MNEIRIKGKAIAVECPICVVIENRRKCGDVVVFIHRLQQRHHLSRKQNFMITRVKPKI